MKAIETTELTKYYGRTKAVENLNLEIEEGVSFGFLGPNGAGKTTTIKMLAGVLRPTRGRVKIFGYDVWREARQAKSHIGYLPEASGFYDSLTAFENLDFLGALSGMPRKERRERIFELLEFLGLSDKAEAKVGSFSHGMKQKLALAQALLHRPKLLILDEPTSGLDPAAQYEIRNLIRKLREEGYTIFLSSHLLFEVEEMCTEVGIIDKGKLIAKDSIENLRGKIGRAGTIVEIELEEIEDRMIETAKRASGLEDLEIEERRMRARFSEAPATSELVRLLVEAGAKIRKVEEHIPSLEEIFLKLTRGE